MIADELDATRTQAMTRPEPANGERPGLMTDLDDLAKHAAQVADRLEKLRLRLDPVLAQDLPMPARIDDQPAELTHAQHRARVVAVTLHSIDDQVGFLLEGIRL